MESKIVPTLYYQDPVLEFSNHGVGCFAIVKYLASSLFRPINRRLFCFYFFIYSHYDLLNFPDSPEQLVRQPFDLRAIEHYVLSKKLGLDLCDIDVQGPFSFCIQRLLEQGLPVIVPVDKNILYSLSEQDGEAYPLLVIGYDNEKHVFIICDDVRNYQTNAPSHHEKITYAESFLEEEKLEKAFRLASKHHLFIENTVQVLSPCGAPSILDTQAAFNDIKKQVEAFQDDFSWLITRKFKCIQQQIYQQNDRADIMRLNILRYINSQKIIGETMLQIYNEWSNCDINFDHIISNNMIALNAWKKFLMISHMLGNNTNDREKVCSTFFSSILRAEQNFLQLFLYTDPFND